jgi:hypothetical protein
MRLAGHLSGHGISGLTTPCGNISLLRGVRCHTFKKKRRPIERNRHVLHMTRKLRMDLASTDGQDRDQHTQGQRQQPKFPMLLTGLPVFKVLVVEGFGRLFVWMLVSPLAPLPPHAQMYATVAQLLSDSPPTQSTPVLAFATSDLELITQWLRCLQCLH